MDFQISKVLPYLRLSFVLKYDILSAGLFVVTLAPAIHAVLMKKRQKSISVITDNGHVRWWWWWWSRKKEGKKKKRKIWWWQNICNIATKRVSWDKFRGNNAKDWIEMLVADNFWWITSFWMRRKRIESPPLSLFSCIGGRRWNMTHGTNVLPSPIYFKRLFFCSVRTCRGDTWEAIIYPSRERRVWERPGKAIVVHFGLFFLFIIVIFFWSLILVPGACVYLRKSAQN